jgi:hypothetical protein
MAKRSRPLSFKVVVRNAIPLSLCLGNAKGTSRPARDSPRGRPWLHLHLSIYFPPLRCLRRCTWLQQPRAAPENAGFPFGSPPEAAVAEDSSSNHDHAGRTHRPAVVSRITNLVSHLPVTVPKAYGLFPGLVAFVFPQRQNSRTHQQAVLHAHSCCPMVGIEAIGVNSSHRG